MDKINFLPHCGFLLTTACNLNCRNCADLVPYKPLDKYDKENVIHDLEKLLKVIDKIGQVLLIGGETLLYPDLKYLLAYCLNKPQIGRVIITTNGTIQPDESLYKLLQNPKALLRLSGYPESVTPNRPKIVAELQRRNINCENMEGMQWRYMGDNRKRNHSLPELQEVFKQCGMRTCVHLSADGRMFFCSRQHTAFYTPDYPAPFPYETVDVRNLSEHDLFHAIWQFYRLDYISTCDYCDGLNEASPVVPTARQILPKEEYVKLLYLMISFRTKTEGENQLKDLNKFLQVIRNNKLALAYEPENEKFYRIIALCEVNDGKLVYEGNLFDAYGYCMPLVARLWRDYRYEFINENDALGETVYKNRNLIRIAMGNAINCQKADMYVDEKGMLSIEEIKAKGQWVNYD